jgi:signal transduction histidine kinase
MAASTGGHSARRSGVIFASIVVAYFTTAVLGLSWTAFTTPAALVWAPSGIALAAVILLGRRAWLPVFIASLLVGLWYRLSFPTALVLAFGSWSEAVVGAYLMERVGAFRPEIDRLGHAIALVVFGGVLSTALSATIGVTTLHLVGLVGHAEFATAWHTWWLADAVGVVVFTPFIMTLVRMRRLPRLSLQRVGEIALIGLTFVVVSAVIFLERDPRLDPYMIFPIFMWATIRFGIAGATIATCIMSIIASVATAFELGPFTHSSLVRNLTDVQAFMAIIAVTGLFLGAAIEERRRAVEARKELLAIVSHDLRSPLSAIAMASTILAKELPKESVGQKHVGIIRRGVERMSTLLKELLDLTTLEAGGMPFAFADHDACQIARDAVDAIRPIANNTGLKVDAEVPPGKLFVRCDRERLLQLFSNLLGNAVRFTPTGGSIKLRVELRDREVYFATVDTGSGIPPEHLPHLFERFWRGNTKGSGTGLGLAIAKAIVEAHGSRIGVVSEVGRGSTFYFKLPVAGRTEAQPLPTAPPQPVR